MSSKKTLKRSSVAAYAAAIAASVGIATTATAGPVQQVQRYCTQSWRNAGIEPQDWQDCTQEVFLELYERLDEQGIQHALLASDSQERQELKRAVWRIIQRWRRSDRPVLLSDAMLPQLSEGAESTIDQREFLDQALERLSPRQRRILHLWSQSWSIEEIAKRLSIPAPRVSDEKYKAIQKLKGFVESRRS